jgi:hypothetical protein
LFIVAFAGVNFAQEERSAKQVRRSLQPSVIRFDHLQLAVNFCQILVQADESLTSALMLSARLKDSLAQMCVLRPLKVRPRASQCRPFPLVPIPPGQMSLALPGKLPLTFSLALASQELHKADPDRLEKLQSYEAKRVDVSVPLLFGPVLCADPWLVDQELTTNVQKVNPSSASLSVRPHDVSCWPCVRLARPRCTPRSRTGT